MNWPKTSLGVLCIGFAVVMGLTGCAGIVNKNNPALAQKSPEAARVYIIRPDARHAGATARPLQINIDKTPIVQGLDKARYVLLYVVPGQRDMHVFSYTQFGAEEKVIPVDEGKVFHFDAGKTYYIFLEPFYRGFHWGTSYRPVAIDHAVALRKAGSLKPVGEARRQPLRIE